MIVQAAPYPASSGDLANVTLPKMVWSWFTQPLAISIGGRVAINGVATDDALFTDGDSYGDVATYHVTSTTPTPYRVTAITTGGTGDDHEPAAFLRRKSDGKILAFSAGHNVSTYYLQTSVNAGDVSAWGTRTDLNAANSWGLTGFSYAQPHQLDDEANDPIHLLFRGTVASERAFHWAKSIDGGATWPASDVKRLIAGHYYYIRSAKNGEGRIDVCIARHPDPIVGSTTASLYHIYYQGGSWYKLGSGTALTLPINPLTDLDPIWDGTTTQGPAWLCDIQIDSASNPVILFTTHAAPFGGTYRIANRVSGAWNVKRLASAGGPLIGNMAQQPYYTGIGCIDPDDTNKVYLSQRYRETWRMLRLSTLDSWSTWTTKQLATGTPDNYLDCLFRPMIPKGQTAQPRLAYLQGTYSAGATFNTDVKMVSTAVAGTDPATPKPFDIVRVQLRRQDGDTTSSTAGGTGKMLIHLPGFGTPVAARFRLCSSDLGGITGLNKGSIGYTDGVNHACVAWHSLGPTGPERRASTNRVAMLWGTGSDELVVTFDSFVQDGLIVNVTTNTLAGPKMLEVMLFRDCTVSVGTKTLTTQNNSVTVTTGADPDFVFMSSAVSAFNNTDSASAIISEGFASRNGAGFRQCSNYWRNDNSATSLTNGAIHDNGAACFGLSGSQRYAELNSATSTGFNITSRGADLSSFNVAYMSIDFNGTYKGIAGVVDMPTATGPKTFAPTGIDFTPFLAGMTATMHSAVNTDQNTGEGFAFGASSFNEQYASTIKFYMQDGVTSPVTASVASLKAVDVNDHTGTAKFAATLTGFGAGQINTSFTVVDSTVRKACCWAIGYA